MTAPILPLNDLPNASTAQYISTEQIDTYQSLDDYPDVLQAKETVMVYIGPSGRIYDLNGPRAGRQGVALGQTIQGDVHLPFEQVITEGAYQLGATIERANIIKRLINFRVAIKGANNYAYRLNEGNWWDDQDESNPGWLGIFTRFGGWRWIPVYPYKTIDTAQQIDPVAFDNNLAQWDINWVAPIPYYSKPALYAQWKATTNPTRGSDGFFTGTISLSNCGDMPSNVSYLISGKGNCVLQDNNSDRMVTIPTILDSDGAVLVETDPMLRPIIAANDPQDDAYYNILRASGLLNYVLAAVVPTGTVQPIWLRGYIRFLYNMPPVSSAHFTVKHDNPAAVITAIVPQRFKRSR